MKILVSACLMGENCKYNGGNNRSELLLRFTEGQEVIPVCPEVMGGLPVPRIPCEIRNGEVINREGVSCDEEFRRGAAVALAIAEREKPDLAVLQSRSPSCGIGRIYDGSFSKTLRDGDGIFAGLLRKTGIPMVDVEELGELWKDGEIQ